MVKSVEQWENRGYTLLGNSVINLSLRIILVAFIYFIAARLGLMLELGNTNATPVWPPSGIAFAALLLLGVEAWPGITIGAFIVNVLVFYENKATGTIPIIAVSFIISIGNTLEAVVGYYLLKQWDATRIINKAKDFALFFIAALLMCTVSATVGVSTVALSKIIPWYSYGNVWFTWWLGDVSGIIVLTPVLLSWANAERGTKVSTPKAIQIILLFIVLGGYLAAVFAGILPIGLNKAKIFFIFFILIWCAFRMNQWQSSLVVLFLSAVTTWYTLHLEGPFIESSQNESLLSLQVFLCIASVTMMFLSTTLQERRLVERNLKETNVTLEEKVEERTEAIERQKLELQHANEQLTRRTVELENANNDARFFAHLISHDLREPLRTITGFLQLLHEHNNSKLNKEATEYINYAITGAKRMHALIEDMLIYSGVEHGKVVYQEVNINEVIAVVKSNLYSCIAKNNATLTVNGIMPVVYADFSQMVQLFQNIIDNAIKYQKTSPEISITAEKLNSSWRFSIKDNGIGIPAEHLDRIFIILQRLHTYDKYEGTGIGLAICKKIVEGHGGKIWAESVQPGGATFYFTLPVLLG